METIEKSNEISKRKIEPTILDAFSKLTHNKEKERIKSGALLMKYLANREKTNNEFNYVLNRLIRGVGSTKPTARIGFYSTLVTLLKSAECIDLEMIFNCMDKELRLSGSNSKSENADAYMGQILICGATFRSGLFMKSTLQGQKRILEQLLNAGKQKSYLTLASHSFLVDLFECLDEDQFKRIIWPVIQDQILKPLPDQSLDDLYLLVMVKNKYVNFIKNSKVEFAELVCCDNVQPLCNLMMNISRISVLQHPIYPIICQQIANSKILIPLVEDMDRQLSRPNRNKLIIAATVLRHVLENITDFSVVPSLLTENFMKQTLDTFRNSKGGKFKDHQFHQSINQFFEALLNVLKNNSVHYKIMVAVLEKLLFDPGTFFFEKLTKTKLIQQITICLTKKGVKKLAKLYKDIVLGEKKLDAANFQEHHSNMSRVYAAQLLVKLLAHSSVQNEADWKIEQLKFFIDVSLLNVNNYMIGSELSISFRDTFFGALNQKLPKLEDLRNVLSQLVHYIESHVSPENYSDMLKVTLSPESFETWQELLTLLTKLETKKVSDKKKYIILVFHTLFLHMGLQLFKNEELALNSLKELFVCYKNIKHKSKMQTEDNRDDTENILWIEVITDLFLNLLSQNSQLLRNIINCVFPHLCSHMTSTALHQILNVLNPKIEANPLSVAQQSDSEDSAESDDHSDVEESNSDSAEEIDEDEEDQVPNDKLKMALQQALGSNGYHTDEESIDINDMDEDEGQRLNEALADAFKQFKPNRGKKSKKQSKDEETLTHFRIRVLDLIEIYLDSTPSMISCLEIMLPLLQTLEFSIRDQHQQPLQHRVRGCLKKLTNLKKFASTEGVNDSTLRDIVESLLSKGSRSTMLVQDMADKIAECCIFVVRCAQIVHSDESIPKKLRKRAGKALYGILKSALLEFLSKRDCLTPYVLFKRLMELNRTEIFKLIPTLFDSIFNDNVRPFRKTQALELLRTFYSNHRLLTETTRNRFNSKLGKHQQEFLNLVLQLLETLSNNPEGAKIKEKFLCNLFNVLNSMKSNPLNSDDINWMKLGELVCEYRSNLTLSKDTKQVYNKLCKSLGIPHVVKMKSKTVKLTNDTIDHLENAKISNGSSTRSKVNEKQLSKQTRLLRLKNMSEGFSDSIRFSSVRDGYDQQDSFSGQNENGKTDTTSSKNGKRNINECNQSETSKRIKYT